MKKNVIILILTVTFCGCGPKLPDNLPSAKILAEQHLADSQQARDQGKMRVAERASKRAIAVERKARELYKAIPSPTDANKADMRAVSRAARHAVFNVKALAEEIKLKKKISSLTCKLSRASIDLAVSGTLLTLQKSAEAAAAAESSSTNPPAAVTSSAEIANAIAEYLTGSTQTVQSATNPVNWTVVAGNLKTLRCSPPEEIKLLTAAAFGFSGMEEFALYEIESVNPVSLRSDYAAEAYLVARGLILHLNGMTELAAETLLKGMESRGLLSDGGDREQLSQAEKMAIAHLLAAGLLTHSGRYEDADRHLASLLQVMPDNPFARVAQSEAVASTGSVDLAENIINQTDFSKCEWLKDVALQQMKKVRDNPLSQDRLFSDPKFLARVIFEFAREQARRSETAKRLDSMFNAASKLGKDLQSEVQPAKPE